MRNPAQKTKVSRSVLALAATALLLGATASSAVAPGLNGRVAFQTDAGGTLQIGVVNDGGAGFRLLTATPGTAATPAWSPTALVVAFSSDRDGEPRLYVMGFATGAVAPLTSGTGFADDSPAWSPDGSKVAFTRCALPAGDCDVWTIDAMSLVEVNLTQSPASHDRQPAWSPDGTRIAFVSERDGNPEIYTMLADGTSPTRLTIAPEADAAPDWSPDGAKIAFARVDAAAGSRIWTILPDGTMETLVGAGEDPAFSPDGARIAFVYTSSANADLYVMNADGSGAAPLVATSAQESSPSWQPLIVGSNLPPVADAGLDLVAECVSGGAAVTLDGSLSTDPDSTPGTSDDIVLYEWWEDFGAPTETFLGAGITLPVTLPFGSHQITLQVTDSVGQTATDDVLATVVDTTPPEISVEVTPSRIWPPNHKMVTVQATVVATDACGAVTVVLDSVTSSEPDNGEGDGNTWNDVQGAEAGTADFSFKVRAERSGKGPGRVYTATYTATDEAGNAATSSATITVPHDKSGKPGGVITPCQGCGDDKGGNSGKGNGKGDGGKSGNGNGHDKERGGDQGKGNGKGHSK